MDSLKEMLKKKKVPENENHQLNNSVALSKTISKSQDLRFGKSQEVKYSSSFQLHVCNLGVANDENSDIGKSTDLLIYD